MLLTFSNTPGNELEKEGRSAAPPYGEAEVVCPNCHRTLKLSQAESNMMTCTAYPEEFFTEMQVDRLLLSVRL